MSEVYLPENVEYPQPMDCSLDLQQIVGLFGRRARMFCKSSANKYLFSYLNDWCVIVPIRSNYRIIGQLPSDFKSVKSTINFDVYFVGSLVDCKEQFLKICRVYLRSWSKVETELF